jgi:AcrR family transcriptional regulator
MTPSAASQPVSPRRARARRGEGELLHAEILSAAERLLLDTGDESAVSIRAVADAVGVTPPSIYLHFRDRNELIFAVVEEQFTKLDHHMQRVVEGITDPIARIEARGRAYIDFGLTNPEHYRILMTGRSDATPERFVDARLADSAAFAHVLTDVQSAIAETGVDEDPVVVACGLWIAVHGLTSLLIAKPMFPWPPREQLIDHVLESATSRLHPG